MSVVGAAAADDPSVVVVAHDLRDMTQGVVHRRVQRGKRTWERVLELAHGCVSCTLRLDLLPLLRSLSRQADVARIVLVLDVRLEPEQLCWALEGMELGGTPVADDVQVAGIVAALDPATWLADVCCSESVAARGLAAAPDDDRSIAQLVIAQAEMADVIVWSGQEPDAWTAARTAAAIERLNAAAVHTTPDQRDWWGLLDQLPVDARRGELDDPHGALLRGRPPLSSDAGIGLVLYSQRRPFHPQRFADALDLLPAGILRLRGRLWVASQPETVLWLEVAGPDLRLADAGLWLAAQDDEVWRHLPEERAAWASLRWDDRFGDRSCELVALTDGVETVELTALLDGCLLTEEELAAGDGVWRALPDPFAPEPGAPDRRRT